MLAIVALVTGCSIVERPGPESITETLRGSLELTRDRPVALVPVTVDLTPGPVMAAGFGYNEHGSVRLDPSPSGVPDSRATVIAIPSDAAQPRAWRLGPSVLLPVLTPAELYRAERCRAGATCEHAYRLLVALDEPAQATLPWELQAGISLPAGTETGSSEVDLRVTGEVRYLADPPAIADSVDGTLTAGGGTAVERIVRLRYEGPRPNAWPVRAEAIIRAVRPDGARTPLVQLDLLPAIGPGHSAPRIFAEHIGPELTIVANLFNGCAAFVACERFLVLHVYDAPTTVEIDWDVQLRVADYERAGAVNATVSVDELTAAEADAIAGLPCTERAEAAIDLATMRDIITEDEEARQLALLAAGTWTPKELGDVQFESLCRSLGARP